MSEDGDGNITVLQNINKFLPKEHPIYTHTHTSIHVRVRVCVCVCVCVTEREREEIRKQCNKKMYASYAMGTGSFSGVKRPGRGVDHNPT